MPDESAPNTRTVTIPYLALITRADPDWQRDHQMQVEDERRPQVKHRWASRGPYAED